VKSSISNVTGSCISVLQVCKSCGKHFQWSSQPMVENIPAGNIILSASILFAGAIPSKVLRVMEFCGLECISLSTFYRHQKAFLLRTVSNIWQQEQSSLLEALNNKPLVLGGDGRNDSMGHCAKYGSYSLMDLEENKILDIQLVQVPVHLHVLF